MSPGTVSAIGTTYSRGGFCLSALIESELIVHIWGGSTYLQMAKSPKCATLSISACLRTLNSVYIILYVHY